MLTGILISLSDLWGEYADKTVKGEAFEYGHIPDTETRKNGVPEEFASKQQAVDFLIARACEKLPPATRFEIRAQIPTYYGRGRGISWYRHPSMDADPSWEAQRGIATVDQPSLAPEGNHIVYGAHTTPA